MKTKWIYIAMPVVLAVAVWGVGQGRQPAKAADVSLQAAPRFLGNQAETTGVIDTGEVETLDAALTYSTEGASNTQVVHYPGASFIKVHFAKLNLSPGDYVTVSDPKGTEVYTYHADPATAPKRTVTGDSGYTLGQEGGFWAISISGDTALVELHSQGEATLLSAEAMRNFGVALDKYTRGYPESVLEEQIGIQSTCGTSQRRDVACYQSSRPTEFGRARAVARLLLNNGTSSCTSWRVGPNNHMLTNEHCITSQAGVSASEAWFNYQRTACGGGTTGPTTKVTGRTFLTDDRTLDFALFTVNNFSAISGFGFLELDVRRAVQNEQIYIPQHGGGAPKQFGIESDQNTGNLCRVDRPLQNGRGSNTDIGYACDTIGGSSGSPVLARSSNRVIALHHFGGCPNGGVRIDLIWPRIRGFLGSSN